MNQLKTENKLKNIKLKHCYEWDKTKTRPKYDLTNRSMPKMMQKSV